MRYGRFRLHDVPVSVIGFCNLRFRLAFCSGTDLIHLPKDVFQDLLLGIVHRRNFLRVILIRICLYGVNRKHIFPHGSASTHFKHIIGYCVFFGLQLGIILRIDFLHHRLHTHTRSAVLARKEYPEHRAEQQPNQANHDNYDHRNPASGSDGGNQSLCCRYNRLDCGNGSLNCNFYPCHNRLCCSFCSLCRPLSRFRRSLCRFLSRLCCLLCCLD